MYLLGCTLVYMSQLELMRCWFVKELSLLNAGEKLIYTIPEYRSEKIRRAWTPSTSSLNLESAVKKIITGQLYHRIYMRILGVAPG
jgi:hypothetical protein